MKIIKPSVEFYGAVPTDYEGTLKFIEIAGRTCYKSEDKIGCTLRGKISPEEFTPDYCAEDGRWDDINGGVVNCGAGCKYHSAWSFVKKLIKARHLAMVEHSNFVVRLPTEGAPGNFSTPVGRFHSHLVTNEFIYIGGNLTAWYQAILREGDDPVFVPFIKQYGKLFDISSDAYSGNWQPCPHDEIPKELHRYSAKFITDRGVTHEIVRHRPTAMDWYGEFVDSPIDIYKVFDASLAQESTRYVNYGGKDMEFIEPAGFDEWSVDAQIYFENTCGNAEYVYAVLLSEGLKPQQARAVLPNALKTEIVVTADAAEWAHIRKLRTHPSAQPDMVRVMNMMPWDEIK